jgi:hypothetical protein
MNVRLLATLLLLSLGTVSSSAAVAQEAETGETGSGETETGDGETEEDENGSEPVEDAETEGGETGSESTEFAEVASSDEAPVESIEEPAPLRNVIYTTALGGGVSLGYGSLDDGATGGHGYVLSNFALEMSRVVGLVGGLGYQFRSGGSLIDESPESLVLDSRLGTAHYLLVEVGARFTVAPNSAYSPRLSALLQGQIELGVEEVNVFANDTPGRAFQEDLSPWFVFEYGQPVFDSANADVLIGLRASQALASTYRSTGDNSFDLFLNPGGNLDGRLWFTQVGLWVGVEY